MVIVIIIIALSIYFDVDMGKIRKKKTENKREIDQSCSCGRFAVWFCMFIQNK